MPGMFRTSNPVLNPKAFSGLESTGAQDNVMTVGGTVGKTAILLVLLLSSASWTWYLVNSAAAGQSVVQNLAPWFYGGMIGGLIFAFATIFKKTWAPVTAPLYAICEGLFLGAISGFFDIHQRGIVIQAVAITFGVLACMLAAYMTGVVRVTQKFKMGVIAGTGALCLFYFIIFILQMFGVPTSAMYGAGPLSIGISLIAVVLASLNLALDFDMIDQGALAQAPKYMEWYGAFGLMVTLVWLYIELLRLISKVNSRR